MLRAVNIFQRRSFAGAILPSDATAVARVPRATPLTLLAGLGKLCGRSPAAHGQFLLVKGNMV